MVSNYYSSISENPDLIRKGLEVAVFVAPITESTDITALLDDTTGDLDIPAEYEHVGLIEKDQGATWSRDTDSADVNSAGHAEPTRRDITSDVSGLQFIMQESKLQVMGIFEGQDLSGVSGTAAGSTHSTFSYDKPSRPAPIRYRVLAIAKDGDGDTAVYQAKWLPSAQVTEKSEQSWNEGTEIQYQITLTAFVDSTIGTSVRNLWGVPNGMATDMGISA